MPSVDFRTPLPVPTNPNPTTPGDLTEKEQQAYDLVLAHFANPDYALPGVETDKGALIEVERMWLSFECILRFIRATGHDTSRAIKRLEGTLKWRRDFGLYTFITPEYVEPEALNGKMFTFGYDTCGRPAIYISPKGFCVEEGPRQIHFTFWFFERAIELMGPGIETLALMINHGDKTSSPSWSTSIQTLTIVQTHYPERLGAAMVAQIPWLLHTFYRLINPFIDPITRMKLIFNPVSDDAGLWRSVEARDQDHDNAKLFERDQLVVDGWSGALPFLYTHEVYWPALLDMTEKRRNDMTRVWRDLGGVVGIKEWDVKVGVRDMLAAPSTAGDTGETL